MPHASPSPLGLAFDFSTFIPGKAPADATTRLRGLVPEPAQAVSTGISTRDWDELFHAVEQRLLTAAAQGVVQASGLAARNAAQHMECVVLECVMALDQLQAALAIERGLRAPEVQAP